MIGFKQIEFFLPYGDRGRGESSGCKGTEDGGSSDSVIPAPECYVY